MAQIYVENKNGRYTDVYLLVEDKKIRIPCKAIHVDHKAGELPIINIDCFVDRFEFNVNTTMTNAVANKLFNMLEKRKYEKQSTRH